MLQAADGVLLLSILAILGVSELFALKTMHRQDSRIQKYKLYKVRDDLIYLVASGKLRENDFVFQFFYDASNFFVKATHRINLTTLVEAIKDARQKGLDPAMEEKTRQIHKELATKDKEVVAAAAGFYRAMLEILIENSYLLKIAARYALVSQLIAKCADWTRQIRFRPVHRHAYIFYQDYTRAAAAI